MTKITGVTLNQPFNIPQALQTILIYLLEHDLVSEAELAAYVKTNGTTPITGLQDFQLGLKTDSVVESTTGAGIGLNNQFYALVGNGVTAAGTNQATATLLTKQWSMVDTVSVNTKGCVLPVGQPGMLMLVENVSANTFKLYPGASSKINGGTVNVAITVAVGQCLLMYQLSASAGWRAFNLPLSSVTSFAGGQATLVAGTATITVPNITTSAIILLQYVSGTLVGVVAPIAGTGTFDITSTTNTDTAVINWYVAKL